MEKDSKIEHVVVITTSYPHGKPGSEAAGSFVEDFVLELSKKVQVSVIAAGSINSRIESGNIIVYRFAVPKLPLSLLNPIYPGHWIPILLTLHRGYQALKISIRENRPDHIFALWALPSGCWAKIASRKYGIPYSIWALGSDIWGVGRLPFIRSVLRRILDTASNRYADGHKLTLEVQEICHRSCEFLPSTRKISYQPKKYSSSSGPYKLAFLGRWHPNKGPDLLLNALFLLNDRDWGKIAEIRVNGGGPLGATLQEMVNDLQAQGHPVYLGGYLGKDQATALLNWADYVLIPSRIESIPVIFSDAVKLETPIISTPVGDLPYLYDKYRFGLLAEQINAESFSRAIRIALDQKPSMYRNGLLKASEDFDLSQIVSRFLDSIVLRDSDSVIPGK